MDNEEAQPCFTLPYLKDNGSSSESISTKVLSRFLFTPTQVVRVSDSPTEATDIEQPSPEAASTKERITTSSSPR